MITKDRSVSFHLHGCIGHLLIPDMETVHILLSHSSQGIPDIFFTNVTGCNKPPETESHSLALKKNLDAINTYVDRTSSSLANGSSMWSRKSHWMPLKLGQYPIISRPKPTVGSKCLGPKFPKICPTWHQWELSGVLLNLHTGKFSFLLRRKHT